MAKKKIKEVKLEVPPVADGFIDVQLTEDELRAIINLLSFTKDSFAHLAEEALKNKNAEDCMKYAGRAKVSESIAAKLAAMVEVGEPTNRNVH
jgi:hypothetical protein